MSLREPGAAAIDQLEEKGPALARPLADHVKGSKLHKMKGLRPGSAGASEVRILFCFDPERQAVLLAAGDKQGNWSGWYKAAIRWLKSGTAAGWRASTTRKGPDGDG